VKSPTSVLIITINFRQTNCTLRLLESISSVERFNDCYLVIVDNCSENDSVPRIQQAIHGRDNVELAVSPRNRGYFGAARWALDRYLADHPLPSWVIVCNNDITFDDSQFLRRLIETDPTAVGMVAPSIISSLTKNDANPSILERPSSIRMLQYRLWFSSYHAMWIKQWLWPFIRRARKRFKGRQLILRNELQREIYAPHGAFLIFSRQFFESGGFIDDGTFLFGEEFVVAEMCRRLCLPIMHDPLLRVWHAEGQTLGRMLTREMFQYQKNGFRYALARYKDSYRGLGRARPGTKSHVVGATSNSQPFQTTQDSAP
jgi:GT2 family glycosyltransferase